VTVRRLSLMFSVVLLACVAEWPEPALAQAAPAENHEGTHVRLGDSVVALDGPWKFKVGDSPIDPATNEPLWAEPGLDDSNWETVDLTPQSGSHDPIAGTSEYVPGWTAKGHPG
jgi:hypothetical protein